jgi:hypothetical protein
MDTAEQLDRSHRQLMSGLIGMLPSLQRKKAPRAPARKVWWSNPTESQGT